MRLASQHGRTDSVARHRRPGQLLVIAASSAASSGVSTRRPARLVPGLGTVAGRPRAARLAPRIGTVAGRPRPGHPPERCCGTHVGGTSSQAPETQMSRGAEERARADQHVSTRAFPLTYVLQPPFRMPCCCVCRARAMRCAGRRTLPTLVMHRRPPGLCVARVAEQSDYQEGFDDDERQRADDKAGQTDSLGADVDGGENRHRMKSKLGAEHVRFGELAHEH